MKRLAIIPARGGSKRIPHKNIKEFCGRPMIEHVLGVAKESGVFDTIHISTDNPEIRRVATDNGCPPDFPRPLHLADDYTSIMEVLKFTVESYAQRGKHFESITLLYATSPLMDVEDLKKASHVFEQGDQKRALLSVSPYPTPIEKAWVMDDANILSPKDPTAFSNRTQDLDSSYHDAGMFCIYTSSYIQDTTGAGNPLGFRGYSVPTHRVTDIDDPEDWVRAEALFKVLNNTVK